MSWSKKCNGHGHTTSDVPGFDHLNVEITTKWIEGNVLFNSALNTFYLWLYGVRYMVKDHSESKRGNMLPPLHAQGIFYMYDPVDRIVHTTAMEPTTHCIVTKRSTTELHFAPSGTGLSCFVDLHENIQYTYRIKIRTHIREVGTYILLF